jgi:hypothetical protein
LLAQIVLGEIMVCPSAKKLDGINFCLLDVSDFERIQGLKKRNTYGAEVNYFVLKRNYKKLPANVTELLPNSLLHDAMNRALDLREPEIIALLVKNGIQDHDNNFSSAPHLTVLQDLKGQIKNIILMIKLDIRKQMQTRLLLLPQFLRIRVFYKNLLQALIAGILFEVRC